VLTDNRIGILMHILLTGGNPLLVHLSFSSCFEEGKKKMKECIF